MCEYVNDATHVVGVTCHIFNKIEKNLTRLPCKAKAQMTSGQGSHWLIESPAMYHLCVTRPPEICVNLVFKHIHVVSIYTICR